MGLDWLCDLSNPIFIFMSREIKFRAKCSNSSKFTFVYGYFTKDYVNTSYVTDVTGESTSYVDENTLGQFTGLKDKNGKEIYEGDIVSYCSEIHQVVFQDCAFMYAVIKPKDFIVESIFETHKTMTRSSFLCEVIGNIHENHELLTQH